MIGTFLYRAMRSTPIAPPANPPQNTNPPRAQSASQFPNTTTKYSFAPSNPPSTAPKIMFAIGAGSYPRRCISSCAIICARMKPRTTAMPKPVN
jgi:hypothetical protein